jgi:hypothetical protein
MRKIFVILNSTLILAVLFSILFQSVHSYEHFSIKIAEKDCVHKQNSNQEITHQHHNFENCLVCDFTFSTFIPYTISAFEFNKTIISSRYSFFKSREITQFFKGSLFALRAPPIFIV